METRTKFSNSASLTVAVLLLAFLGLLDGCSKSPHSAADPVPMAFAGTDVNVDGTISAQTLATIEGKASEPALAIDFQRTRLSDAGLMQLAKFKNIRRIDAVGSAITDAGIDKIKQAIPEIEVAR